MSPHVFYQGGDQSSIEVGAIVREEHLGTTMVVEYLVQQETSSGFGSDIFYSSGLNPFAKVVDSYKDETTASSTFRQGTYSINANCMKGMFGKNKLKFMGGGARSLYLTL